MPDNEAQKTQGVRRRRPPMLALLSFGFFVGAIVAFFLRSWGIALTLLALHWGVGAIVVLRKHAQQSRHS